MIQSLILGKKSPTNFSRTVGVFFGSSSPERIQSQQTAKRAMAELLAMKYNTVGVFLDKGDDWHLMPYSPESDQIDKNFYQIEDGSIPLRDWSLHINDRNRFRFSSGRGMSSEEVVIDIAFPVFHGLSGEDGTFQGLCDLLSVPYIGCGLTTSALALDKVLAKDVLNSFGIPTKAYLYFSASEWSEHAQILSNAIEAEIELPVFVKPARVGSGLGVSKVSDTAELADAVAKALEFDSKILVEEAVSNPIDIMVSVTGNYFKPEQIQISKPQYRDPDTKLFKSVAISKPETEEIITLAKKTFIAFEGTGISQIDIIKNSRDNSLFVTEVDTIPHDLALPAWEASNISAEEVIRELVRLADENYEHLKNK